MSGSGRRGSIKKASVSEISILKGVDVPGSDVTKIKQKKTVKPKEITDIDEAINYLNKIENLSAIKTNELKEIYQHQKIIWDVMLEIAKKNYTDENLVFLAAYFNYENKKSGLNFNSKQLALKKLYSNFMKPIGSTTSLSELFSDNKTININIKDSSRKEFLKNIEPNPNTNKEILPGHLNRAEKVLDEIVEQEVIKQFREATLKSGFIDEFKNEFEKKYPKQHGLKS